MEEYVLFHPLKNTEFLEKYRKSLYLMSAREEMDRDEVLVQSSWNLFVRQVSVLPCHLYHIKENAVVRIAYTDFKKLQSLIDMELPFMSYEGTKFRITSVDDVIACIHDFNIMQEFITYFYKPLENFGHYKLFGRSWMNSKVVPIYKYHENISEIDMLNTDYDKRFTDWQEMVETRWICEFKKHGNWALDENEEKHKMYFILRLMDSLEKSNVKINRDRYDEIINRLKEVREYTKGEKESETLLEETALQAETFGELILEWLDKENKPIP